jgi:hypothetical protein
VAAGIKPDGGGDHVVAGARRLALDEEAWGE